MIDYTFSIETDVLGNCVELRYIITVNDIDYSIIKFNNVMDDNCYELYPWEDDIIRSTNLNGLLGLINLSLPLVQKDYPEEFI